MRKNYKKQTNKIQNRKSDQEKKKDKLHVKWKGSDNSFNSWCDNKDLI